MKHLVLLTSIFITLLGHSQKQNNVLNNIDSDNIIQHQESKGNTPIRTGIDYSSFPIGSVIEFDENNKPYLCQKKYSSTAVGVIVIIKGDFHDFVKDGVTEVLVISGKDGIKKGDFLITSNEAGYLMKATETGAYFGVALNNLPSESRGLLKVRLEHGYYVPPNSK